MKEIMKKHYIVPVSEVVATCPDVIMAGSPLSDEGHLFDEKVIEGMEDDADGSKFKDSGFQFGDEDLKPGDWSKWEF